jgi:hypothetical protein
VASQDASDTSFAHSRDSKTLAETLAGHGTGELLQGRVRSSTRCPIFLFGLPKCPYPDMSHPVVLQTLDWMGYATKQRPGRSTRWDSHPACRSTSELTIDSDSGGGKRACTLGGRAYHRVVGVKRRPLPFKLLLVCSYNQIVRVPSVDGVIHCCTIANCQWSGPPQRPLPASVVLRLLLMPPLVQSMLENKCVLGVCSNWPINRKTRSLVPIPTTCYCCRVRGEFAPKARGHVSFPIIKITSRCN